MPYNQRLRVLIYRGAAEVGGAGAAATALEALFAQNGSPPQWRDGVFAYQQHYQSTALGFATRTAHPVFASLTLRPGIS